MKAAILSVAGVAALVLMFGVVMADTGPGSSTFLDLSSTVEDTYVIAAGPFGTSTTLNPSVATAALEDTLTGGLAYALVKWDQSSIPSNATIAKMEVHLKVVNAKGWSTDQWAAAAGRILKSWDEDTATETTRGSGLDNWAGKYLSSVAFPQDYEDSASAHTSLADMTYPFMFSVTDGSGWATSDSVVFDVTYMGNRILAGDWDNNGIAVYGYLPDGVGSTDVTNLGAVDNATVGNRPQVYVWYNTGGGGSATIGGGYRGVTGTTAP